jgi:alkylation response protein AidB-like acyl-CoA dehydrogenase
VFAQGAPELCDYAQRAARFAANVGRQSEGWTDQAPLPESLFREAAPLVRERWGDGLEAGLPLAAVLFRELAPAAGGASVALSLHSEVFLAALARSHNDAHRELMRAALDGTAIGCLAVTEDTGGSDLSALRTLVTRTDSGWHVRGVKRFITNAMTATHTLVLAVDASGRPAMLVAPLDHPGIDRAGSYRTLGVHPADSTRITLDADLPAESIFAAPGFGLAYATVCLSFERLAVVSQVLGDARTAVELTIAFLRERRQGGVGGRLFDLQALRHNVADLYALLIEYEALFERVLLRQCRSRRPLVDEIAMAKLRCAAGSCHIIDECMQLLGGRGYTQAFPIERLWRDTRLARIGSGTDQMMREIIAATVDHSTPGVDEQLQHYSSLDVPDDRYTKAHF